MRTTAEFCDYLAAKTGATLEYLRFEGKNKVVVRDAAPRRDVAIAYVIQYARRGGHVHNAMRPLGCSTVRSWLAQIVTKNTSVIQYQRDEFTANTAQQSAFGQIDS